MPIVSVIVPCYNEETTIQLLLSALDRQTYPREKMEVVIADGMSTDRTRSQIEQFQTNHPDLKIQIVDNDRRTIPSGLNRAIEVAQGDYVIRLDAHSMPERDYVSNCVAALEKGMGDIVGGVWNIQPGAQTWIARSIALAASHPLGVGDALYRYTSSARAVDTVPFGAFQRTLIDKIGFYNEDLLTNEDYEFNTRVRQSGRTVWLDPSIRSTYFARSTLLTLAKQYWRYGYWKMRMLRKYPETIRWRQCLPPVFVISLVVLCIFALWWPFTGYLLLLEMIVYFMAISIVGLKLAGKNNDFRLALGIPLAIFIMHICWGSAFIWSMVS